MDIDLKKLPSFFTKEDKESLQFLINLNSEMSKGLEDWLVLLTNINSLKTLKETTKGLQSIAKVEITRDETLKEVNELNKEINTQISIYSTLGVDAAVKVLKVITLEMIIKMAEFNIISKKHDDYLGVNYVYKTN
jgi:hypothetical protein